MTLRIAAATLIFVGLVFAQGPRPAPDPDLSKRTKFDTLALDSGPGSFRVEGEGKLVISTEPGTPDGGVGTVYVTQLKGENSYIRVSGMREEYRDEERVCYHGAGRVEISGKWRFVYFLGTRVKGAFTGSGAFELYGDIDKNLNTGLAYYPGFTKDGKRVYERWDTYGKKMYVPMPEGYEPAGPLGPPMRLEE